MPAHILQNPAHCVEFCTKLRPVSGFQSLDCFIVVVECLARSVSHHRPGDVVPALLFGAGASSLGHESEGRLGRPPTHLQAVAWDSLGIRNGQFVREAPHCGTYATHSEGESQSRYGAWLQLGVTQGVRFTGSRAT